jgi:hypothetical protein
MKLPEAYPRPSFYCPIWVQEVAAPTIFVPDIDPLLGAFGSAGAIAIIGGGYGHWITKGWVVKVYCPGGRSTNQKTGSGVTVVGGAEKMPVATSEVCPPLMLAWMVMD